MTDSLDKKSNDKRFYTGNNHFDAEIDAAPLTDISDEEDAIDRLLIDTGFDQDEISSSGIYTPFNKEAIDDSVNNKSGDSSMEDKSQKAATTDTNDLRQSILLINLESRTKKAILLSYAAISTASVAIIAAIALTFNAYRVQMNISSLSDTVKFFKGEKAISLNTEIHKVNSPQEIKTNTETNTIKSSREVVWYLNLVSFKDLNEAKLKSVEFMKKGILTEINKVKVNNENWYRLRVGGFTSREQADGYAKKIRKTLHLNAMWIADS